MMLDQLRQQLEQTAAEFTGESQTLGDLLRTFSRDVERALNEPLEIFPVAHHSPASALHMVRRLQERQPKVIYIELCEDMRGIVSNLEHCKLPVALQAFASESPIIPTDKLPVTVVAPLTEASAEYQAIAYCMQNPETQLVFVDRAVDYVFQWKEFDDDAPNATDDEPPDEEAALHASAVGVEIGALKPTFDQFLHLLLKHSNTRTFAEWWEEYVERAIIGADLAVYKQVMFLVGSLIRHLGRRPEDVAVDELREKYMWTRMKQHMRQHHIAPEDAIHICGAAHAASTVPEFGTQTDRIWEDLPPLSETQWLFGLIPSSFVAIEYQFGHPAGTVSLAESTWQKSLRAAQLSPFTLGKKPTKRKANPKTQPPPTSSALVNFLTQPPEFALADHDQLLDWCTRIVASARNNGYLASTADSIAIYETSFLLANIRSRMHPSANDFIDAAITCLEKDRTPKKRNITQLCQMLLGGNRVGTVGYESLPPLAQNIYDRLAPLGIDLFAKTNQRALMDFTKNPELRDCSELLWRLHYMLGNHVVQPIMGERKLGHVSTQESWEVRIGKYQGEVIQLGYEGVSLEQVLEGRMRQRAFADDATTPIVLHTAEASILYLSSARLTREFGDHATHLLSQEVSASHAPEIFDRARRLTHYYRMTSEGLPHWLENFVGTGYTHYGSLLPNAMSDNGTEPQAIAGMFGFIFTLESLALSVGCSREQIIISLQQVDQEATPAEKIGLLWTAEWLLNMRTVISMREFLTDVMANPLRLQALPNYLTGYILALSFAPRIARFVVEILSNIFVHVTDAVLIPWLPSLMLQLRDNKAVLAPLLKEASGIFPTSMAGFHDWHPQWLSDAPPVDANAEVTLNADQEAIRSLLLGSSEIMDRLSQFVGG